MKRRVLIADDAVFMRMMLKDIITKLGMEVAGEAENGSQAVERFKELKPDLVTLDITMPEKDGITALGEIIAFDKQAKIIMISAMGQHKKVTEALSAGAKDFIIKPFNPGKVIDILKKYI